MDQDTLNMILAAQSQSSLSPDAINAIQQGLSRTDLAALLTPALGVGTGVVNEAVLAQGLRDYLLQQQAAADRERAAVEAAVVAPVRPVQVPIVGQIQERYRQQFAGTDLGDAINTAMLNIYSAGASPEGEFAALEALYPAQIVPGRGTVSSPLPAGLKEDLTRLADERDFMQRAERDYAEAQAAYEQQRAALPAVAPLDYEQLKRDYFAEIGLPALAQLPTPGQQYEISPQQVLAARKPTQRGTTQSLAESMLLSRRAQPPKSPAAQMPGPIAQTSGPTGARAVLAKQQQRDLLEGIVAAERDTARLRAERMGPKLAAQGRTPYQDAMRQLLGIGVLEAQ